jgi:hypothetical protein
MQGQHGPITKRLADLVQNQKWLTWAKKSKRADNRPKTEKGLTMSHKTKRGPTTGQSTDNGPNTKKGGRHGLETPKTMCSLGRLSGRRIVPNSLMAHVMCSAWTALLLLLFGYMGEIRLKQSENALKPR